MKKIIVVVLLLCGFGLAQEKKYEVPASELTEQQRAKYEVRGNLPTAEQAHQWVGLGKEIGEAVNGSLSAVTTQANNFAQTPVGKLTAVAVMWKVMGSDAYHLFAGLLELLVFIPLFLWSYWKMCVSHKVALSKEGPFWNKKITYQLIPYVGENDFTPRVGHALALAIFTILWCITMFVYSS